MKFSLKYFIIFSIFYPFLSVANELKKIQIVDTNNAPNFLNGGDGTFVPFDEVYLKSLRDYLTQKKFRSKHKNEIDVVMQGLDWVTKQWAHDGMNQPPSDFRGLDILKNVHDKKERYRCVEYGIVLADLLQSLGFITRTVSIKSPNVAYGGFGQGHVAMEVWINELEKWIFLDPQFGAYITEQGKKDPLNYYEIFLQKKSGNWAALDVHFISLSNPNIPKDRKNAVVEYKNFLKDYFGFMSVSSGKGTAKISLMLEATDMPLTFQAGQSNDLIYTDKSDILYPLMNKTSVLLEYQADDALFMDTIKKLNIQSDEDYLKNMHKFAAVPKFIAKFKTNTPLHKFYEYRLDPRANWQKVEFDKIKWDATNQENYLEVRSVNKFDRRGSITYLKIAYK